MTGVMSDSTSYSEGLKRPDGVHWIEAMQQKIPSHESNNTWVLEELAKNRRGIRNQCVFKTKRGIDDRIERNKQRFVNVA